MQAYALQQVLSSSLPDDEVRQIGYLSKRHYDSYYAVVDFNFKFWLINPHFYKNILSSLKNIKHTYNTRKFLRYYEKIPHIAISSANKRNEMMFDVVILGSDIIWDYSQRQFGADGYLFGLGFNAHRIVAYAPSFGTVTPDMPIPEYVRNGLNRLTEISVRDENSANIVEKITGNKTCIVLDPTLLWNFKTDENIVLPNCENYILVYGIEFSEELIGQAKKYAAEKHLKLIWLKSGNENFDWCDVAIDQDQLSPFEWAGYFQGAEAIMTSRYHGLLFGLIFEKKIIFFPIPFIMAKADSLIAALDLKTVLVDYTDFANKINWMWDYSSINEKLNCLRVSSKVFLREAIGE